MTPNEEYCKGCQHWRDLQTTGATGYRDRCCHCLLDTGERRKDGGDKCLSRKERRRFGNVRR